MIYISEIQTLNARIVDFSNISNGMIFITFLIIENITRTITSNCIL